MNKRGLGRGLDALFSGVSEADSGENVTEVTVADIVPNRFQPRREFDPDRLAELASSIKLYGVLQPIVVRRQDRGFELVAGERRFRASQIVGLKKIPALIRDYTDAEMTAVALVENLQRENLNPIEEAFAYRRLIEEFGFTQEEVSQKVGKSRPFIANTVRLLNLPLKIQDLVSRGTMTPGQARPLLVLPTAKLQEEAATEIVTHAFTAREAEELARQWGKKGSSKPRAKANMEIATGVEIGAVEDNLSAILGARVRIVEKEAGKGTISIEYYSVEELEHIVDRIVDVSQSDQIASIKKKGREFSV